MSDSAPTAPGKTAGQIKRLRELYVQLESHARIGLTLFQRDDFDAFDDNWQKREAVFGKLVALGQKLQPVFADWDAVSSAMQPKDARQSADDLAAIRSLAESTRQIDDQLRPLLENSKQELRGTLQKINDGRKLIRAYGGGSGGGPYRKKAPAGIKRCG